MRIMTATLLTAATAVALTAGSASAAIIGELGVLDDSANGGINPETGLAWAAGDTYRLFFVSENTLRDATSPNIADYHAEVSAAADAAGLGTDWYAVLQTWNDPDRAANAYNKGSTSAPILMVNNAVLADGGTGDLVDINPNVTENGNTYNGSVASGSSRKPGDPNQNKIEHGNSGRSDGGWWQVYNGGQASQWHFYAISGDLTVVPEPGSLALLGLGGLLIARRRRG